MSVLRMRATALTVGVRAFARRCSDWITVIASYDFMPWTDRYVADWLREPVAWFVVAAAAAGLAAVSVAPQAWLVCVGLVCVTVLGVVWPWLSAWGVRAELTFESRHCREFDESRVILRIRNRWPWPVYGFYVDDATPVDSPPSGNPRLAVSWVPGWTESRYEAVYVPQRRGVFPNRALSLATGFPFGLYTAKQDIALGGSLIVGPCEVGAPDQPLGRSGWAPTGGRLTQKSGVEGDVLGAREYRVGDSLRQVHWAQTARRDALVVRERQAASNQRVLITLDEEAFLENDASCDWALRVFATLALRFRDRSFDVAYRLNGRRHTLTRRQESARELLDRLARFEPQRASGAWENAREFASQGVLITSGARWRFHQSERSEVVAQRRSPRTVVIDVESASPDGLDELLSKPWMILAPADLPVVSATVKNREAA